MTVLLASVENTHIIAEMGVSTICIRGRFLMLFRIYGLRRAGDDHIFLIGQTHQRLQKRKEGHIKFARSMDARGASRRSPKTIMIMEALRNGGVEIVQLDEFEAEPQYARNRDGSRGYAFASPYVFDRERFWQVVYLLFQGGPMWIDVEFFDDHDTYAVIERPRLREKRMTLLSFDTIPTDADHIRVTHDVDVVGITLDPGRVVLQEFFVINESDHALDFAVPHISHVADKTLIEARSEALFTWDGESRWCYDVSPYGRLA